MKLPSAEWQAREGLQPLLVALGASDGLTRYVGGVVRDTLLGLPVTDIDLATRLAPKDASERITAAGYKVVPTGIAHGTVTAVLPSGPVEVTTLRRDVSTDGRRATVSFTDDWREDAARRDFTINALSADPAGGAVFDPFGGLADLEAKRVRFIGDPLTRIAEDHLRILRFFRFHARFGEGEPDPEGLAACAARANDLMALSRERIADELLKLLGGANPAPGIGSMLDAAILRPVLPEIDRAGLARLAALIAREAEAGVAPEALRRLAALIPPDPRAAEAIAARLKLSKVAARRLIAAAAGCNPEQTPEALAYRLGTAGAIDRLLLDGRDTDCLASLAHWTRPRLEVGGGDLIARGLSPGPIVAATLQAIERQWITEGFPGPDRVAEIVAAAVAQALAPRQ